MFLVGHFVLFFPMSSEKLKTEARRGWRVGLQDFPWKGEETENFRVGSPAKSQKST
jgi:hypothetical protein